MQFPPSNSTPRYPSEILARVPGEMHKYVPNNTLWNRAKNQEQPEYPSTLEQINQIGAYAYNGMVYSGEN